MQIQALHLSQLITQALPLPQIPGPALAQFKFQVLLPVPQAGVPTLLRMTNAVLATNPNTLFGATPTQTQGSPTLGLKEAKQAQLSL